MNPFASKFTLIGLDLRIKCTLLTLLWVFARESAILRGENDVHIDFGWIKRQELEPACITGIKTPG